MYLTQRNYREILKDTLRERQGANPLYSMTAFARDLGLTTGMLSLVLRGQRGLSSQVAGRVANALRLTGEEKEYFVTLVESTHARSPKARRLAHEVMLKYTANEKSRSLQNDAFRVISDWYHFAILELMKLSEFVQDPLWIADSLGISPDLVTEALERLQHLELIEKKDGRFHPVQDAVFAPEGVPSQAIRRFHRQVMEKAIKSLEEQTLDERYVNTTFLAIDEKDIPVAQQKIREFHLELMKTVGATPSPTRVYSVSVQMFALSKKSPHSNAHLKSNPTPTPKVPDTQESS